MPVNSLVHNNEPIILNTQIKQQPSFIQARNKIAAVAANKHVNKTGIVKNNIMNGYNNNFFIPQTSQNKTVNVLNRGIVKRANILHKPLPKNPNPNPNPKTKPKPKPKTKPKTTPTLNHTIKNDAHIIKKPNNTAYKFGVVITTHGYNGVFIEQTINCYLREMPKNTYIVVYINESNDKITLALSSKYLQIEVVYIENQTKFGGLTGTWNDGIDKCINNNCDRIILSNDDILFGSSISHILYHNIASSNMEYYGPVTNNPGPSTDNMIQHYSKYTHHKSTLVSKQNDKYVNLNGFFMVFNTAVLIKNKFNNKYYFDPSYPFGGNETEWFKRFLEKGGKPVIVPKTFIYHYKLATWRNTTHKNDVCLYTINTGGYEGENILLDNSYNKMGCDVLYFTDNINMIEKCLNKNILPFFVTIIHNNPKQTQRTIKTSPHLYLPHNYNISVYVDGNVKTSFLNVNALFRYFNIKDNDLICFKHPSRTNIKSEANKVIKENLETVENVNKIIAMQFKDKYLYNNGLTETNVLIRKHKNLLQFNEAWTNCINICKRDQISFDYLLWKYNVKYMSYDFKYKPCIKIEHVNPLSRKIK